MSSLIRLLYATLIASSVYAAPLIPRAAAVNIDLIRELVLAPTVVDRVKSLLADDPKNFVFNFVANTNKTGPGNRFPAHRLEERLTSTGGRTVLAKRDVFPALIGTGISASMGFIGPCGMFYHSSRSGAKVDHVRQV